MTGGLRCMICALLLVAGGFAEAANFSGKVVAVLDGDTLLVLRNNRPVKVRLAEIDAPEKMQAFGETSKRSLSGMVLGKEVKVSSQAVDRYGRLIAHLDLNGLNVNAEQVRRGMAWASTPFASLAASRQSLRNPPHGNQALAVLQEEARQAPRGLWALSDPVPPWEWRKLHPNADDAHAAVATAAVAGNADFPKHSCGSKKYCSEMSSCEEAMHYLTQCGIQTLDGNGDGVPCDKLCAPSLR